ncbi:MAG TPA: MarR family transcriptional regulator [Azospirillaceae bacterium]|nr:MarR family transcriptional regulator [Azospirillaceae bacterium]HRQ79525.1 MarR family transcriptional regulator [Azospirillaceae bacterium]
MPQSDAPLRLSNQACFALYAAGLAMNRVYRPLLETMGLTYPQYLALLLLWEQDDRTLKDLGEQLGLDSGTLTPLLKRMEGQGLITRARDPDDERLLRVRLTAQGAALQEQARCLPATILETCGWTPERLARLRGELNALRDALNQSAG